MKTVQLLILLGIVYYCAGFGHTDQIVGPYSQPGFSLGPVHNGDFNYPLLCPDELKCKAFCLKYGFDGGCCEGRDNRKCHCYVDFIGDIDSLIGSLPDD